MQVQNNVSFTGKKEIIYGLGKAAKEAKEAEACRRLSTGPYGVNRSGKQTQHLAVMDAYIDMCVNDNDFYNTIKTLIKDKDTKCIAKDLTLFNTFDIFKQSVLNHAKKKKIKFEEEVLNNFVNVFKN